MYLQLFPGSFITDFINYKLYYFLVIFDSKFHYLQIVTHNHSLVVVVVVVSL